MDKGPNQFTTGLGDIWGYVLEPHNFPLAAPQLFTPGRVRWERGSRGEGGTIIHPAEVYAYQERGRLCATLRLVCRDFHAAVTPWMLHSLWFVHPWQVSLFLRAWADKEPSQLRPELAAVRRLRVDFPLRAEDDGPAPVARLKWLSWPLHSRVKLIHWTFPRGVDGHDKEPEVCGRREIG
jgi:hypothetical protein